MRRSLPLALILLFPSGAAALTVAEDQEVDFASEIRPLLSDRCFICHGPDQEARESDLRLDIRSGAIADLGGKSAIVPGNPAESVLLARLRHPKARRRMPPPHSKLTLDESEIALLERWILEGAEYEEHWAFRAPVRPQLPEVKDQAWVNDDLDRFVLARLESEGLAPSPPADRQTWLRRVSFDLCGLPPTPDELDDFLGDESPDARERAVDRLLSSKRHGERLASDWLDAARYADSYGYQNDRERRVWPWRDWVVKAFNEGLAWDEFVTWQLAGDLLPEAKREQRLATAFNRLHRQTNEGGSVEEEYRVEYVADRVHTFGTAFLGLTMECARCHDHKYDSITQEEYYGLFAFFDDIDESGLYSHFTSAVPTPTLWLPDVEQERRLLELDQGRAEAQNSHQEALRGIDADFETWTERSAASLAPAEGISFDFDTQTESKVQGRGGNGGQGQLGSGAQLGDGRGGKVLELTGEDNASFAGNGEFSRDDPFTIALWLKTPGYKERAVVFHRSRAWTDAGSRGYQLLIEEGRLSASLIHFWPGNAIRVRALEPLPIDQWVHVAMTYDGSSTARGLELWIDSRRLPVEVIRDRLTRTIHGGGQISLTIGQRFRDRGFTGGQVDDFFIFDKRLSGIEIFQASLPTSTTFRESGDSARAWLATQENARELLREYFERSVSPTLYSSREELLAARRAYSGLVDQIPEIMAMEAMAEPRKAHFLDRGAYTSPRHEVLPGTPTSVLAFPQSAPSDRLGLARWLTDDRNPLFARVSVNRYWQLLFGSGLVATPENFGSQGDTPEYPELLDYLAVEFRDNGWSVKSLLRRLVLSSTYGQSSSATRELLEQDPHNRLLARGPRRQLSAEMIRDNALFVGDLLVEKLGGPPVKPYQPAGLWQEKSGMVYAADQGEGLWRRSLYSFWKRTSPPPSMMIFDASKRDVCVVQRQRTSSPLQALALWNDPQQVEAARGLAQRVLLESGPEASESDRLARLFRWCTSRSARSEELEVLTELLNTARESFSLPEAELDAWLSVGEAVPAPQLDRVELAALAVVANTMLGFDSTLTLR